MKLRRVTTRVVERAARRDITELAVMVQFGALVVAVAAQRVARIVSAEDARAVAERATPSVLIDDEVLPAWELSGLLGLDEPTAAWLVVTTSDEPRAPRIALGTGPCVAVAAHGQVSALPGGVVTTPSAAVVGVFPTDRALRDRGLGHLGIRLDPLRLIGASNLAAARRGAR